MRTLCGRRCWVVGCGLLGSVLLRAARAAGMQSLGLDCCRPADVVGDAAEPAVLATACAALEPELIVCCAATHGGDEAAYRSTYLELPQALQAACPAARLVFCSSSSVYGGQGGAEVSEGTPCRAVSARARLLLQAEAAVQAHGGVVARLVPLYGEGRCELLRRFLAGEPELPGAGERCLNYVHVEDAARALLGLMAHALRGTCPPLVNVAAESFTKNAVYAALSHLCGKPRIPAVAGVGRRGVSDQRVSAALLRSLGWEPQVALLNWALSLGLPELSDCHA